MVIPIQLKDMRFLRVRFKDKRPFENAWQKNHYTYEEIKQYFPKENYGVMGGPELRLLDDDTPEMELHELYNQHFPKTMKVRGHLYFKFDNKHGKKIIFNHYSNLYPDSKGKYSHHAGELQGEGAMCVGAGSTHPDGSKYELIDDLPIQTISYDKFMHVFDDYFRKIKPIVTRAPSQSNWSGDNITDIPIGNILGSIDLQDMGNGCFQGEHPIHGSNNGKNFRVDTNNNTWYCFRCQSGGGPSELIAVMEGIVDCSQVGPSCYSTEQAQDVIKIAREKYGLEIPEQDLGEVKGWAKSVSIVNLAKKRDFENCPKCKGPWRFQDSHGLFYCDTCKYGGGLPDFAHMINEARKEKDLIEEALSKL